MEQFSYVGSVSGHTFRSTTVLGLLAQGVTRRLSKHGLWSYLMSGAVQEPFTLVDGVRSAELQSCRPAFNAIGVDIKKTLLYAVRKAECRDAFLSGGVDSGSIVSLMRQTWPTDEIRTYCIIHEDSRTDERTWARLTSDRNRTVHTEFLLTDSLVKKNIEDALNCYDQPSVDGINNYFASKFVSEAGVRTILSGAGGDEVFAGYGQYAKPRMAYRCANTLRFLPRWFGGLITRYSSSEKVKKFGQMFGCPYDPYFLTRRQFDSDWIGRLLNPDLKFELTSDEIMEMFEEMQRFVGTWGEEFKGDIINRCSWMEQRHNFRSMYLRDAVQTSAPFGLEIKTPLVDDELVHQVMSLPGAAKCDSRISKPLLVRAAGNGLPAECVYKKKQGFALPFDKYLRDGLKDEVESFVHGGGVGLFDVGELKKMWEKYSAGKLSWMRVWQCFVLDWWIRKNDIRL